MHRFSVQIATRSLLIRMSCLHMKKNVSLVEGTKAYKLSKSLLQQHIKAIHFDDPFQCDHCPDMFVYKKSLAKHLKNAHNSGMKDFKYICKECGKRTDDKSEFSIHMDRHNNVRLFKYNMYNKLFFTQSQLTNHLKNWYLSIPKAQNIVMPKQEGSRNMTPGGISSLEGQKRKQVVSDDQSLLQNAIPFDNVSPVTNVQPLKPVISNSANAAPTTIAIAVNIPTHTTMHTYLCSVCSSRFMAEDKYREHFCSKHMLSETPNPFHYEMCISHFYMQWAFEMHIGKCQGYV